MCMYHKPHRLKFRLRVKIGGKRLGLLRRRVEMRWGVVGSFPGSSATTSTLSIAMCTQSLRLRAAGEPGINPFSSDQTRLEIEV